MGCGSSHSRTQSMSSSVTATGDDTTGGGDGGKMDGVVPASGAPNGNGNGNGVAARPLMPNHDTLVEIHDALAAVDDVRIMTLFLALSAPSRRHVLNSACLAPPDKHASGAHGTGVGVKHTPLTDLAALRSPNSTNLRLWDYLLLVGADPNICDSMGRSPLYLACRGLPSVATWLLRQTRADPNMSTARMDQHWLPASATPLMCAALTGEHQLVDSLLNARAAVDAHDQSGHTALMYAIEATWLCRANTYRDAAHEAAAAAGADATAAPKSEKSSTALLQLAEDGYPYRNVDSSLLMGDDRIAAYYATCSSLMRGHEAVGGAGFDIRRHHDNKCVLSLVESHHDIDMIRLLVQCGADPSISSLPVSSWSFEARQAVEFGRSHPFVSASAIRPHLREWFDTVIADHIAAYAEAIFPSLVPPKVSGYNNNSNNHAAIAAAASSLAVGGNRTSGALERKGSRRSGSVTSPSGPQHTWRPPVPRAEQPIE